MKSIYRISDNSYTGPDKTKLANATKTRCLMNFLQEFGGENDLLVLADKLQDSTKRWVEDYARYGNFTLEYIQGGSSAQSFRCAYEKALTFDDSELVYLVEDDYLHLPHSRQILLEGLQRAEYVSLVDYPDKYVPGSMGGNPLIDDSGSDLTRVILTKSSHWRITNSTTCTFAASVKTLREDYDIWKKWCFKDQEQKHPHDFQCFLEIRQKRSLITPIPSLATHTQLNTLAPLVDWAVI